MNRITIEHETVRGIPLLRFLPQDGQKAPVVFYVHGYFGQKETGAEIGLRLAQQGMACIAPDAPEHGQRPRERLERVLQPGNGQVYPPESGLDVYILMLDHILEMVEEISGLMDELAADPRLDMNRAGITGLSFGGMVAFQAAAAEGRLRAAVPMISMPASLERWEDLIAEASSYSQWAEGMAAAQAETDRRAEWLREHGALQRLKNFAPKPLLVLCGDQDTHMPKSYAVRAVRSLQPAYALYPDQLKLTIHDGVAHQVSPQMMQEMLAWFQKYL